MMLKIIGVCCIMLGCGGYGFYLAYVYRMQIKMLRQLITALDYMECELLYRQTPLAEMLKKAANCTSGRLNLALIGLANELDLQLSPDAATCMATALRNAGELPAGIYDALVLLGRSMGTFDSEGQLKGIRAVRTECENHEKNYLNSQDSRVHMYQTLGVCAGAAIVILLI